jgi:hypothetical protein
MTTALKVWTIITALTPFRYNEGPGYCTGYNVLWVAMISITYAWQLVRLDRRGGV